MIVRDIRKITVFRHHGGEKPPFHAKLKVVEVGHGHFFAEGETSARLCLCPRSMAVRFQAKGGGLNEGTDDMRIYIRGFNPGEFSLCG